MKPMRIEDLVVGDVLEGRVGMQTATNMYMDSGAEKPGLLPARGDEKVLGDTRGRGGRLRGGGRPLLVRGHGLDGERGHEPNKDAIDRTIAQRANRTGWTQGL